MIERRFTEPGSGAATRLPLYQVLSVGDLYSQNQPPESYPTKTLLLVSLNFKKTPKRDLPFSESSLKVRATVAFPLASTVNPCFSNKAGLPALSFWAVEDN